MKLRHLLLATAWAFIFPVFAQPTNNDCINAIQLCPSVPLSGTTTGATTTGATDYNFCYAPSSTVWYKFTTNALGGNVTIDFTNLSFNPDITMGQQLEAFMIAASTPCSIPSYTPYSACGNGSTNFSITSAIVLAANTTYYVQVNGANTGVGVTQPAQCDFDISITGNVNYFTEEEATICYGSDYTFPDGSVQTSIIAPVVHSSNLVAVVGSCDSIIETLINVHPQVNVVATQAGVTLTANAIGADYVWVDCNNGFSPLPFATGQSYTATLTGDYACIVTENGCSDTATCFNIDFTGMENQSRELGIEVFPNPSNGIFNINFNKIDLVAFVEVKNVNGSVVMRETIIEGNFIQFDLSNFESGIYFVQVISSNGSESKFVKLIKI